MAEYIAIHKKSKREYGPYSEAQKTAIEASPTFANKYTFQEIKTTKSKPPVAEKIEDGNKK